MLAALAHRGSDHEGLWASGPVALGHRALWTTPESRGEAQPWRDPEQDIGIVMDGRIDNRDALAEAIEARGIRLRANHDAELAIRAYECWGKSFPRELAGDFALAVWDGRRRRLICARDPMGVKPFYYHSGPQVFRWSSEPQGILADPAILRAPDEGMIAEILAGYLVSREDTLWRGVRRLPPGHILTVDAGRTRVARYWPPVSIPSVRHASDRDYAEHFRSVLDTAVRSRLRAVGPIAAHLSGGIDSSSVVVLAQRALDAGAPPATLEAFTQTYPQLPADERPFAEEVAAWSGVKWHPLLPDAPSPACYEDAARRYLDFPDYPNGAAANVAIGREAAAAGARVMLTGMWGNAFLEGSAMHLADLLRAGRLREAVRTARSDRVVTASGLSSVLWHGAVRPLVPQRLRRAIAPLLRQADGLGLVPPAFARRVALGDRLRAPEWAPSWPTFAQRGLWQGAQSAWNVHTGEVTERGAARLGLEERHPFADRRLVEHCLGLPESQRWRGTTLKVVLRESMRGLVPEAVRTKAQQPDLSFLHMEALEAARAASVFADLRLAAQGWVDAARARELHRRACSLFASGDPRYALLVTPLWSIYGLELWLRAASGEAPPCR